MVWASRRICGSRSIDRVRSYCLADLGFSNLNPPPSTPGAAKSFAQASIRIASHSLLLSLYSAFVPCPIQGSLGGAHSDPFIPISGKLGRFEVLLSRKVHYKTTLSRMDEGQYQALQESGALSSPTQ
ncbi:conserved hypothetical protein [Ricinus communis]|uniref:Uncharacterized protein n=1 Tax=Ricinus communis TaxID=3988 RepID=B9T5L1_RICCO|nr:conserved hypothetical protein [Ricinus communis]